MNASPSRSWHYAQLAKAGDPTINPKGRDVPFDPSGPNEKKHVQRGGSFLCNPQYCSLYIVGTRGKGDVNAATNHLGFRWGAGIRAIAQRSAPQAYCKASVRNFGR